MLNTLANVTAILKEHTEGTSAEDLMIENNPFIGIIPKRTDFGGKYAPLPFSYAPVSGVSPVFQHAQAAKGDMSEAAWQITTNDMFALFSLDHKAVTLTRYDADAFYQLVKSRSQSAMKAYRKVLAHAVFGNGGGSLGQIATTSTSLITLADRASMWVMDRGMQLQVSTTDGTSGSPIANDIQTVAQVNRGARSLAPENTFLGANWAVGNHVFLRGGHGAYIRGMKAWFPTTAPSSALFFNVNRTIDDRMYGVIVPADTGRSANLEEHMIDMASDIADYGGEPSIAVMNPRTTTVLRKILGQRIRYGSVTATRSDGSAARNPKTGAVMSFPTVKLATEVGEIDIISDRNCDTNLLYMVTPDSLRLWSAGPLCDYLKYGDDTNEFVRHGTENAMEARLGGYMQFCSHAPQQNGVSDITAFLPAT